MVVYALHFSTLTNYLAVLLIYILLRCSRSKQDQELAWENSEKLTSGMVAVYGESVKDYDDEETQRSNPGGAISPFSTTAESHIKQPHETELHLERYYCTDPEERDSTETKLQTTQNCTALDRQNIECTVQRVIKALTEDISRIYGVREESDRPEVKLEEILQHCNHGNIVGDGMTATVHKLRGEATGIEAVDWVAVKAIDLVSYVSCVLKNGWPEPLACRQLSLEIAAYELLSTYPHPNLLHALTAKSMPLVRKRNTLVLLSEYRECSSLADVLVERQVLEESEARGIVEQVAKALYHMHYCLFIAHRDIKLDNIICYFPHRQQSGSRIPDLHVEVIDFGHCRPLLLQRYQSAVSTIPSGKRLYSASETKGESNSVSESLHDSSIATFNMAKNMAAKISGLSADSIYAHVGGTLHYQSPELLNYYSDQSMKLFSQEIEAGLSGDAYAYPNKVEFEMISSLKKRWKEDYPKLAPLDLQACDIWALGVVTYALVSGKLPFFSAENDSEVYNIARERPDKMMQDIIKLRIRWCQFTTPIESLRVSPQCKSFLHQCLNPDPKKRIKIEEVITHDWVS
eukprot:gb/GECG01002994.1/.p1 GENE.gb/GECG01002994.1/~~gb/GECG01002994.1/.p1  ORF type:complete len:574 (+),score=55.13 gb/GECG01002994.1/:1-1722(+)